MHIMKTKNINLVLYSIIRQVRNGDKIRYDILDDNQYFLVNLNRLSEAKNTIYIMQKLADIKREIDVGKHVKIEIYDETAFTIHKEEGEYYIDNAETLLKYIVFDMIHDVEYLKIVLKDENGEVLRNNKLFLGVLVNFKSILLLEKRIPDEFYGLAHDILQELTTSIKEVEEFKSVSVYLSNKKDRFQFEIVI